MAQGEMTVCAAEEAPYDAWTWDDDPTWPEEGEVIEEMWGLFQSATEFRGRTGWVEGAHLLALARSTWPLVSVAEDLADGLTGEERNGLLRGVSVTRWWGDPDYGGEGGSLSLYVQRLRMPVPLPLWLCDWREGLL